jgi:hypothetical protein
MVMVSLLRQSRIGLAGGRRVGISEMAKDLKAQKELEELLVLMEAIEKQDALTSSESGPDVPEQTKQSKAG